MRERLSKAEIHSRVNTMLKRVHGVDYKLQKRTNVKELVQTFVSEGWLKFADDVDLRAMSKNMGALGVMNYSPQKKFEILLDQSLQGSPRYDFTLAHEVGHFCLHRAYMKSLYKKLMGLPADTDTTLDQSEPTDSVEDKRIELRWIEWQANQFALMLLYPVHVLIEKVYFIQRKLGVTNRLGQIYVGNSYRSRVDAEHVLSHLVTEHYVSRDLMWNHLKYTRILEDRRTTKMSDCSGDTLSSILTGL